ncbi:hypothetical protein [Desulfoplanes sp.]
MTNIGANRQNSVIATFMDQPAETPYHENISLALPVAEKLQTIGYTFQLKDLLPKNIDGDQWAAIFTDEQGAIIREEDENAATAICRAAYTILCLPRQ